MSIVMEQKNEQGSEPPHHSPFPQGRRPQGQVHSLPGNRQTGDRWTPLTASFPLKSSHLQLVWTKAEEGLEHHFLDWD